MIARVSFVMPILKKGDHVSFSLECQVVKTFAYTSESGSDIFYIVVFKKKDTPISHLKEIIWGVLSCDGTHQTVPKDAFEKAERLIQGIDFKGLE